MWSRNMMVWVITITVLSGSGGSADNMVDLCRSVYCLQYSMFC